MYATCLFCHRDLGRNEALEHFPVGRRLAFDAATGRLWVVCAACGRWNLTPLEERWEAIEEAERLFRDSRLRVSTDHVGLARVRDRTELVRIGAPQRPELAAWRYARQFARRRRARAVRVGLAVGGVAAATVAAPVVAGVGVSLSAVLFGWEALQHGYLKWRQLGRIALGDDEPPLVVRQHDVQHALFTADADGRWGLRVRGLQARRDAAWWQTERHAMQYDLSGDTALRAAATLLPRVNRSGAPGPLVDDAVALLERTGSTDAAFRAAAAELNRRYAHAPRLAFESQSLGRLPIAVRLALEMASHEDAERRAMEGELADLERAWRDADEIARIADQLLLPSSVATGFERLRRRE